MEWLKSYLSFSVIGTIILGIVLWYFWKTRKNENFWKNKGIPYLPKMNLISFYKLLNTEPLHETQLKLYKTYGRIYGGNFFGSNTLSIGDPELLKDILVKDFHVFHYRRDFPFGDKTLSKMVSILKGEDWKRVRTVITPVFTTKRLKMMTNIINECSKTVLEEFDKSLKNEGINDVKRLFGAFTMDVIARAAFATKINSINDPENIFIKHAKSFFGNFSVKLFILMSLIPFWITSALRLNASASVDFFRDVILSVIKERRQKGKRYNDLLQLLMDSLDEGIKGNAKKETTKLESIEDEIDQYGSIINEETSHNMMYKKLSEDELISQCVLFFSVGYDTTATTISFMAYALALNPECQEKLIKEVDDAFEIHNEMNYDAIRDMKYLDCVVSETLRLYPVILTTERTTSENYKLKGAELTIEKNVIIAIPIYAMHLDPEYFDEPEKFKPERFIEMNHPQYAYLPFGAGPRNCLGMRFALMEIKMCMSNILHHYRLSLAPTTKVPLSFQVGAGFLSVSELPLKVEKRANSKL